MSEKMTTCLWFDAGKARGSRRIICGHFPNSHVEKARFFSGGSTGLASMQPAESCSARPGATARHLPSGPRVGIAVHNFFSQADIGCYVFSRESLISLPVGWAP